MRKFISLAMAVAMTLSLVPATAFAGGTGTIAGTGKIVDAADVPVGADKDDLITGPELQIKVTDVEYDQIGDSDYTIVLDLTLDGAEFDESTFNKGIGKVIRDGKIIKNGIAVDVEEGDDEEEATVTIKGGKDNQLAEGDIIVIAINSRLNKTSSSSKATVSVSGDIEEAIDDLVYAAVVKKGITASIKKIVDVAEEEITDLYSKGLKVEFAEGTFDAKDNKEMSLKLSKGFEFANSENEVTVEGNNDGVKVTDVTVDDNVITFDLDDAAGNNLVSEIVIKGLEVEATTADSGDIGTITVKYNGTSDAVEVVQVVDYKVTLSVDEDEDVPVIYSGVNVENDGLTDDSDHISLEVTAEETFSGAWSMRQGFNFTLPEGVYVTDVTVEDAEGFEREGEDVGDLVGAWKKAFEDAYQNGDYKGFEFKKRVFDDVDTKLNEDKATLSFTLTLVADPTFEGDVELGFEGALVDTQEVTIATFVKPYTVKAEQNDVIIDYRYTAVETPIIITEAADGLWAENDAVFGFQIDKSDYIVFEDDASFDVDEASEMEIDDYTGTYKNGEGEKVSYGLGFKVDAESDEAATVTISNIELFMQRSIPAGPYDLSIVSTLEGFYEDDDEGMGYLAQELFAKDDDNWAIDDVCDYSNIVKEAFINVITAGRDQDDASFTTKVVVPVGEMYLISGENQVALDVPAYITAAGYTMLPVRAVAKALGINNNNVLWNSEARTATILYGQRIITMTVGAKVVNVNGSALPASAAVEITNNRTFLPMRDLATALGVTDITWDPATKTATLNGSGNK